MDIYSFFGYITYLGFLLWIFAKLTRFVYDLMAPSLGMGVKWRLTDKDWAIVTGCTDGIGLEFARQLAAKGYKLLLISRNQTKLDTVKDLILKEIPACKTVDTLAFDFSSNNYDLIESKLKQLERIDVLVNNVGVSYPYPEYFTKLEDWKMIQDLLNINVYSLTKMTHIALQKMEEQNRGIIINLSSYAGSLPLPLYSAYSASKAYVDYFSRALQVEYKKKNIIIQSILPNYVSTNMSKMKPSLMAPSPKVFVRSALNTVGVESRTFGYFPHKLYGSITQILLLILPENLFLNYLLNVLLQLRKKAYRKLNKTD